MPRFLRRLYHFARWVYRPVHGDPVTGKVYRMGPRVVWTLAGKFADDDREAS